jgi:hypothetical protein
VANTVDTVSFTGDILNVEVCNRDGAAVIFFRIDGVAPTVAGDNTYVVLPGGALKVHPDLVDIVAGIEQVQLISSGAAAYSVTGFSS